MENKNTINYKNTILRYQLIYIQLIYIHQLIYIQLIYIRYQLIQIRSHINFKIYNN